VNGAVSNLDEFYEAFDLDAAVPMWRPPELRARIW